MKILVTGGAGFIGSSVIRQVLQNTNYSVVNVDKLTYAGNLDSLSEIVENDRYSFERVDLCEKGAVDKVFMVHQPTCVMHLAAESHVDRSIDSPFEFINTNIIGTYNLLERARAYFYSLDLDSKAQFRFHHVSTDEVYGDLAGNDDLFTESTSYNPSSPYSASKAASDHLVRAWGRTYGLPVLVTNCSNNYGPFQFPEKLIPHTILNALSGKALPIYGDGSQIRDWLYVDDHSRALIKVLCEGEIDQTYNVGGHNEKTNLEVVHAICAILEELVPEKPRDVVHFRDLITFVGDRPGHDARYAIDSSKIFRELSWAPQETFETGLRKTVRWYLDNQGWWERVMSGEYRLERIGGPCHGQV